MMKIGGRVLDFRKNGESTGGSGGTGGITSEDHRIIEIEGMFKEAYATMVSEYAYVNGAISRIDVWSGVDKLNKLFEKTFTYNGDSVQSIELKDKKSGFKVTTSFTYMDGNLVAKYRQLVQE